MPLWPPSPVLVVGAAVSDFATDPVAAAAVLREAGGSRSPHPGLAAGVDGSCPDVPTMAGDLFQPPKQHFVHLTASPPRHSRRPRPATPVGAPESGARLSAVATPAGTLSYTSSGSSSPPKRAGRNTLRVGDLWVIGPVGRRYEWDGSAWVPICADGECRMAPVFGMDANVGLHCPSHAAEGEAIVMSRAVVAFSYPEMAASMTDPLLDAVDRGAGVAGQAGGAGSKRTAAAREEVRFCCGR